jgi:hypothetical protein
VQDVERLLAQFIEISELYRYLSRSDHSGQGGVKEFTSSGDRVERGHRTGQRAEQSWTYCAEERKSASFFFVAPQRKLRFSKAQLRSMRFKILDATLIATFMNGFGMAKRIQIGSYSVVVKSSI